MKLATRFRDHRAANFTFAFLPTQQQRGVEYRSSDNNNLAERNFAVTRFRRGQRKEGGGWGVRHKSRASSNLVAVIVP